MTTFQWRKGTLNQNEIFIGAEGEISVSTETDEIFLHDGQTNGGTKLLKKSLLSQYPTTAPATSSTNGLVSPLDKTKIDRIEERQNGESVISRASKLVNDNGILKNNGKPIRELGYNCFYMTQVLLADHTVENLMWGQRDDYQRELKLIAESGVRYIRAPVCLYYPAKYRDWYYNTDKVEYFNRLKMFFDTAADYGIGIVATLYWGYYTIPDVVGETISAAYGNNTSLTYTESKDFITRFWNAIGDHDALAAWEIGNEFNLPAENNAYPPNNAGSAWIRTDHNATVDTFSITLMNAFYTEIANHIRSYDTERIILSGNAGSGGVLSDSVDYLTDTLTPTINPDPIDTLSNHFYRQGHMVGYDYKNLYQIIRKSRVKGKALGKPFILGEFGTSYLETYNDIDGVEALDTALDIIERTGVQLSFVWAWRRDDIVDWNSHYSIHPYNTINDGDVKYQKVKQVTERIREQGYIDPDLVQAWRAGIVAGQYANVPENRGAAKLIVPPSASLQGTDGFTISFWCKFNQITGIAKSRVIYAQTLSSGFNIGVNVNVVPEMVLTMRWSDGTQNNTGASILTNLNEWAHYTFMFNPANSGYYSFVNGIRYINRSDFPPRTWTPYTSDISFFDELAGPISSSYCEAGVKNIRWFNRPFTDLEVRNLYLYDMHPSDSATSLVGRWDFDGNFLDTSGNGNNATYGVGSQVIDFEDFPL
jgi:hypothetical protein